MIKTSRQKKRKKKKKMRATSRKSDLNKYFSFPFLQGMEIKKSRLISWKKHQNKQPLKYSGREKLVMTDEWSG